MLIFDVIERDHRNIEYLLSEIKNHKDEVAENRLRGLIQLIQELREEINDVHQVKQETIYAQLKQVFKNNLKILCAQEEHNCVAAWMDHCIKTLEKNDTLKGFAQFCIAARMLKNHFKFEQDEIFNAFKDTFSGQELEKIAERYEARRMQNTSFGHM